MRYGDARNLTFALPPAGYPGKDPTLVLTSLASVKFEPNFVLPLPSAFSSSDSQGRYNIFNIHSRWNRESVEAIMPSDTTYISIIREPADMFEVCTRI